MSGLKRAVFVSDLHLGSNPTLDDFTRDREFEVLLELPALKPGADDRLDLVLLGDSFDLWQSVSENECRQEKSNRIDLEYLADSEAQRLALVRAPIRSPPHASGSAPVSTAALQTAVNVGTGANKWLLQLGSARS